MRYKVNVGKSFRYSCKIGLEYEGVFLLCKKERLCPAAHLDISTHKSFETSTLKSTSRYALDSAISLI